MNEMWAIIHYGRCWKFFRFTEMVMYGLDAMIPFSDYT